MRFLGNSAPKISFSFSFDRGAELRIKNVHTPDRENRGYQHLYHPPAFATMSKNLFAVTSKPNFLRIRTCDLGIRYQKLSAKTICDKNLLPAAFTAIKIFCGLDRNEPARGLILHRRPNRSIKKEIHTYLKSAKLS